MSIWLELTKMILPAAFAGVAGYWAHYRQTKEREHQREEREREREDRERVRQAEYDDFKRRRQETGAKATDRTTLVKEHAELLIRMQERGITTDALFDLMGYSTSGRRPKTHAAELARFITRTVDEIEETISELHDRLWWDRHKQWEQLVELGYEKPDPQEWEKATKEAERIEREYGPDDLGWDSHGAGMIEGKLAALLWVSGEEWDYLGHPEQAGYTPPKLPEFAARIQEVVDDYRQRWDEPVTDPRGGDPIKHKLESLAFSVLVPIDDGAAERIVEELHEVYARYVWRGGRPLA